jgi:hypothetical protein
MQKRYNGGTKPLSYFKNCMGLKNSNYIPQEMDNAWCRCRYESPDGSVVDPIYFIYSDVLYVDVSNPKDPICNKNLMA